MTKAQMPACASARRRSGKPARAVDCAARTRMREEIRMVGFIVFFPTFITLWRVLSPNERTKRRGRPKASALATNAARPRSLQ